jgi:hypothetical protein
MRKRKDIVPGRQNTFVPGLVTTRYKCSIIFIPDALYRFNTRYNEGYEPVQMSVFPVVKIPFPQRPTENLTANRAAHDKKEVAESGSRQKESLP